MAHTGILLLNGLTEADSYNTKNVLHTVTEKFLFHLSFFLSSTNFLSQCITSCSETFHKDDSVWRRLSVNGMLTASNTNVSVFCKRCSMQLFYRPVDRALDTRNSSL